MWNPSENRPAGLPGQLPEGAHGGRLSGLLRQRHWTVWLLCLTLVAGCRKKNAGPDLPAPDLSAVPSTLQVVRADELMLAPDGASFEAAWQDFYTRHPAFAVFYRDWLLQIPPDSLPADGNPVPAIYKTFVAPSAMRSLNDTLRDRLGTMQEPLAALDLAYRYHRYYFPLDTLPPVYLYSGIFGQPIDLTPDFAAVALTMFLGRDFSGYRSFPSENLPRFLYHRLEPDYIPVRVMDAVARTRWTPEFPENSVLQHMIYEGKLLAYLDRVMPDAPDSLKIGFTAAQLEWVQVNQAEAWALLVGEELLFSTRTQDIARIAGEGPHTKGMSLESPARVGVWLGWQIVRAYLDRYPDTTLDELFALQDGRLLLEQSRWKAEAP
jgi:hypothetical protein